jgi:NitT/TauT family transport system substrate-binding protein
MSAILRNATNLKNMADENAHVSYGHQRSLHRMKRLTPLLVLLAFAAWGGLVLLSNREAVRPGPQGKPDLVIYTTGQATTPQMPLWKALAEEDLGFTPQVRYWKNLGDLRGALLAGKGDIWVGHVDGFAQAALRGAPVRLVAVTGWRKFYFLTSRDDIHNFNDISSLPETTTVAAAPPQSPGVAVMRALEGKEGPRFDYALYEPKQLALEAMRGSHDLLLLPEPLVTVLLEKNPDLRVAGSLEEEYGRLTHGAPVLPLAGIAVNTNTLRRHPELEKTLCTALLAQEAPLRDDPESGLETLPKAFADFIPPALVRKSLARDVIRVRSARQARSSIRDYLRMILPEDADAIPESFYGGTP